MISTLKRHKLLQEQSEEDRISNLPSCLIGQILSLIPTKDAVATSVLSTRWKEMWKLITCLSFDDYLLQSPKSSDNIAYLQSEFVQFVYRVLLVGRFSFVKTFTLHSALTYDPLYVITWIASLLTCKVQELDICVPQTRTIVLPSDLFTCTTLVKLKLGTEIYMNVPRLVSLPCVKLVDLSWVRFPDDDSITRFLSGCPALDTLKMKKCVGVDVKLVKICNPLLTSLYLTFLRYEPFTFQDSFHSDPPTLRIVIETPFLSYLFIEEYVPEGYVLEKLHKLVSADIFIHAPVGGEMGHAFQYIHHVAISDLLKGISEVQRLHFFTVAIDRLHLPTFENLKEFVLVADHIATFEMLSNFIERSPQLRFLRTTFEHYETFNIGCYNEVNKVDYPLDLELSPCVPDCLWFHLKIIEIVDFRGLPKEVKLLEYFLRNARVLEKMTIDCDWICGDSPRIWEYLWNLPRASRLCQIEFVL